MEKQQLEALLKEMSLEEKVGQLFQIIGYYYVEEGKKFGLNLSASCYAVCLFKILMNSDEKNLLEQTVQASEELEGEVKQIEGVCMFQRGISGLAFQ